MKKSIVLTTAIATALTSGIAAADLSANAAITSNYIWRGVTQTMDQAAGQGGIDWSGDSGLYVGTWVSNVNYGAFDGYEMDLYAGFGGEAGGFGYDLGVITYQYPVTPSSNFTEVYASGSMAGVKLGLNYTVDKASGISSTNGDNDLYISGSYDFSASDVDYSIYAGSYMYDADSADDYNNYGANLSKDGFTFAFDKNDINGGTAAAVRFTASYKIDFKL
jgi:uncharacterized protein (TIGR02001 family)